MPSLPGFMDTSNWVCQFLLPDSGRMSDAACYPARLRTIIVVKIILYQLSWSLFRYLWIGFNPPLHQLPHLPPEPLHEPPVMRNRDHRPRKSENCRLEGLQHIQADIVCRLIE